MAALGRLRCSLPPTCAAPGGGEAPTAIGNRSDQRAAPPLPHATGPNAGNRGQGWPLGEETGCLRHAKPYRAFPPRPRELRPRWGQGARGERRGKRSWRLPQGSRSAEKSGPRTRSAAGPAGSRRSVRPLLWLGLKRFATPRQVWPPRSATRAPRPPRPGCLLRNK